MNDDMNYATSVGTKFSSALPPLLPAENKYFGPKDKKLLKVSMNDLLKEHEYWTKKFRGSIPSSVRNRINRLEKVITVKGKIIEAAAEQSEKGYKDAKSEDTSSES